MPDLYIYERVPGRVFHAYYEDNGRGKLMPCCGYGNIDRKILTLKLPGACRSNDAEWKKYYNKLFYDNLLAYSSFMEHLSRTLYHFTYAYKYQADKTVLVDNLQKAYDEMLQAKEALYLTQHGAFEQWYKTDEKFNIAAVLGVIQSKLEEARNR